MNERKCPRCKGRVDALVRVYANELGTCVIKCRKCGREWGIGAFSYSGGDYHKLQEKASDYMEKWNRYGA